MCDHGVRGCCHGSGHRSEASRSSVREIPVSPVEKKVRDSGEGRCWDKPPCRHLLIHRLPHGV